MNIVMIHFYYLGRCYSVAEVETQALWLVDIYTKDAFLYRQVPTYNKYINANDLCARRYAHMQEVFPYSIFTQVAVVIIHILVEHWWIHEQSL